MLKKLVSEKKILSRKIEKLVLVAEKTSSQKTDHRKKPENGQI